MTRQTLLRNYRKAINKLGLHLYEKKYRQNGEVTLYKNKNTRNLFCPITAVCYYKTNKYYEPGDVDTAADDLGLTSSDVGAIVDAADFSLEYTNNPQTKKALLRPFAKFSKSG